MTGEMQLRLIYSLLKPASRMAAKFSVPVRTLTELVRLSTYEAHAAQGLTGREIGERMGQSPRNIRSFARRLREDFFQAEVQVGLTRELEEAVAQGDSDRVALHKQFAARYEPARVQAAIEGLLKEERITTDAEGHLHVGAQYAVLSSDAFHNRIDALNHFLDGAYRATVQRLIHDRAEDSMIKTITFSARPEDLQHFAKKLEGELRRELAELEEKASFSGHSGRRHTLSLTLSPHTDE